MKKHAFHSTLLLAAISALTSLGIDMGLPAMPAIEARFALAPGRGALTLSVFLAGFALTPLFGGPISDRLGRRPVLLAGLAVFAASALACSTVPGFPELLLARFLQGSAAGVCVSLPLAIIRDSLDGHAARNAMSQVTTVLGVVPLLAPITGSWVLLIANWRFIYVTQATLATVLLAVVALTFKETHPENKRQSLPAHILFLNYRLVLREPVFLVHAFVYGLAFACMFSYISASPLVFMDEMHVPQHVYTLLFACTAGAQVLGAFTSGLLSKRQRSGRSTIRLGLVFLASASILAAALQGIGLERPLYLMLPMMLVLFAFGIIAPSATLGALEPIPHVAGAGSGAIRSLQMILGSAVSAILAWICARPHVDPAIAMTATMAVTALIALTLFFTTLRVPGIVPAATLTPR